MDTTPAEEWEDRVVNPTHPKLGGRALARSVVAADIARADTSFLETIGPRPTISGLLPKQGTVTQVPTLEPPEDVRALLSELAMWNAVDDRLDGVKQQLLNLWESSSGRIQLDTFKFTSGQVAERVIREFRTQLHETNKVLEDRKMVEPTKADSGTSDDRRSTETIISGILREFANSIVQLVRANPAIASHIQGISPAERPASSQQQHTVPPNVEQELRKHKLEIELLRGHVVRRNKLLAEQRSKYLKDLLVLKELLYQKHARGEAGQTDYGSYLEEHDGSVAGEGDVRKGQPASEKEEKQITRIRREFEQERQKLQSLHHQEKRTLALQFKTKLKEKDALLHSKETELLLKEKEWTTTTLTLERKVDELKASEEALKVQVSQLRAELERMRQKEPPSAAAKPAGEPGSKARKEVEDITESMRTMEETMKELASKMDELDIQKEQERQRQHKEAEQKALEEKLATQTEVIAKQEEALHHKHCELVALAGALEQATRAQRELLIELDSLRAQNIALKKRLRGGGREPSEPAEPPAGTDPLVANLNSMIETLRGEQSAVPNPSAAPLSSGPTHLPPVSGVASTHLPPASASAMAAGSSAGRGINQTLLSRLWETEKLLAAKMRELESQKVQYGFMIKRMEEGQAALEASMATAAGLVTHHSAPKRTPVPLALPAVPPPASMMATMVMPTATAPAATTTPATATPTATSAAATTAMATATVIATAGVPTADGEGEAAAPGHTAGRLHDGSLAFPWLAQLGRRSFHVPPEGQQPHEGDEPALGEELVRLRDENAILKARLAELLTRVEGDAAAGSSDDDHDHGGDMAGAQTEPEPMPKYRRRPEAVTPLPLTKLRTGNNSNSPEDWSESEHKRWVQRHGVFERLQLRSAMLLKKIRERIALIEAERTKNLEKVLDAHNLLLPPEEVEAAYQQPSPPREPPQKPSYQVLQYPLPPPEKGLTLTHEIRVARERARPKSAEIPRPASRKPYSFGAFSSASITNIHRVRPVSANQLAVLGSVRHRGGSIL